MRSFLSGSVEMNRQPRELGRCADGKEECRGQYEGRVVQFGPVTEERKSSWMYEEVGVGANTTVDNWSILAPDSKPRPPVVWFGVN